MEPAANTLALVQHWCNWSVISSLGLDL